MEVGVLFPYGAICTCTDLLFLRSGIITQHYPKIIECIKEIVLSLWDRVVFYRERQFATRLELVTQALPIIEQIGDLESSEKIPPEQAEMLRRKIVDGASKFISSGAVIPKMEASASFSSRELMAPAKKYLMPPPSDISKEAEAASSQDLESGAESEIESLSSKEQAQLLKLLKKVRKEEDGKANNETGPED